MLSMQCPNLMSTRTLAYYKLFRSHYLSLVIGCASKHLSQIGHPEWWYHILPYYWWCNWNMWCWNYWWWWRYSNQLTLQHLNQSLTLYRPLLAQPMPLSSHVLPSLLLLTHHSPLLLTHSLLHLTHLGLLLSKQTDVLSLHIQHSLSRWQRGLLVVRRRSQLSCLSGIGRSMLGSHLTKCRRTFRTEENNTEEGLAQENNNSTQRCISRRGYDQLVRMGYTYTCT